MGVAAIGSVGPDIAENAYRSGLRPDREWVGDRPAVLVFHGRENQDVARGVVQIVRNVYPSSEQIVTINVVDLNMYPRTMRKLVRYDLDKVWDHEVANLLDNLDAESHIVILADYSGNITRSWGVEGSADTVHTVVLDRQWRVCRRSSGPGAGDAVLATVRELIDAPVH